MTVPVQAAEAAYPGDGVSVRFGIPSGWQDAAHVFVAIDGVALIQGEDFEVDAEAGDAVLTSAAADGSRVAVWRRTPVGQPKAFPNVDTVRPRSLEDGLDVVTLRQQENRAQLERGVSVPIGDTGLSLDAAPVRAGGLYAFDNEGAFARLAEPQTVVVIDAAGNATTLPVIQVMQEIGSDFIDDGVWSPAGSITQDGVWG